MASFVAQLCEVRRASGVHAFAFSVRRKHTQIFIIICNERRERRERKLTFFFLLRTDTYERVNDSNDEKKKRCNMNRNNCINKTSGIGNERF